MTSEPNFATLVTDPIQCPSCQSLLGSRAKLLNSRQRCGRCKSLLDINSQGAVTLKGSPAASPNQPSEPGTPTAGESDNPILEMLTWLEEILGRMIRGTVRFTLVQVPREVFRALVRWFPTLTKLVKVLCLAAIWLALTMSPLAWLVMGNELGRFLPAGIPMRPEWYARHHEIWNGAIYTYTMLALSGSVWGIVTLRRRVRRRRAQS